MTRQSGGGRERRQAVEENVIEAVERLLRDGESFTGLGVQRIASEAGIARSTFYVHFADKSDLLMRATDAATHDVFAIAEDWVAGDHEREALTETVAAIIAQRRAHAPILAALDELAAYDETVATFWRDRIGRFADRLATRIADEVGTGRAPASVDPETTARWIAWGVERTVAAHVAEDDGGGDARLAQTIARAIWAAIYATDH